LLGIVMRGAAKLGKVAVKTVKLGVVFGFKDL
jgi:hypothetical protein